MTLFFWIGFFIGFAIIFLLIYFYYIKKKNKEKKPIYYDEYNNPIIPIRTGTDVKIKHKLQRPTIFSKDEVNEILKKEFTENNESES